MRPKKYPHANILRDIQVVVIFRASALIQSTGSEDRSVDEGGYEYCSGLIPNRAKSLFHVESVSMGIMRVKEN